MSKSYDDNKKDRFQLVELILIAADIHRTFPATMLSKYDDNDQEYYVGVVIINEGEVIGRAKTQAELENQLDDICISVPVLNTTTCRTKHCHPFIV